MTNTDVNAAETDESTKARRANHEYLGTGGNVVDDEEEAYGYRYTLIGSPEAFEWHWEQASEATRRMLAIFGAKTLSTNTASGLRNNQKKSDEDKTPEAQMAAVKQRFELLSNGQWVDTSREGPVVRFDKDMTSEAICRVLVAEKKMSQADVDSGYKAKIRQKLEDDPAFLKKAHKMPQVQVEYAKLAGKATTTLDDLMSV